MNGFLIVGIGIVLGCSYRSEDVSFRGCEVNDIDEVSEVYIEPGNSEILVLESNPTTGYSWTVISVSSVMFTIEDVGYVSIASNSLMAGEGGLQYFAVKASNKSQEADTGVAMFVYRRPWESVFVDSKNITLYATNNPSLLS
jgi:predicted secreted protein